MGGLLGIVKSEVHYVSSFYVLGNVFETYLEMREKECLVFTFNSRAIDRCEGIFIKNKFHIFFN